MMHATPTRPPEPVTARAGAAEVQANETPDYLCFRLADRSYALDLGRVLAVQPYEPPHPRVGAPAWLRGMYDAQRQHYVPVVDLRALHDADQPLQPASTRGVLILVEQGPVRLALLADAITDPCALLDAREGHASGMPLCRMRGRAGLRRAQLLDPQGLTALLPGAGGRPL